MVLSQCLVILVQEVEQVLPVSTLDVFFLRKKFECDNSIDATIQYFGLEY